MNDLKIPECPRVGFLGAGIMASGMISNLLAAGYPVTVYNRTRAKAAALEGKGASVADSPFEAAAGSDVVFSCLTNGDAVEDLYFGKEGIVEATPTPVLVVDLSTIPPSQALDIGERLEKQGMAFLDAPVSGGDIGARQGTLSIMVGGERAAFETGLPLLLAVGKNITHTGQSGTGQMTKCVNQIMVALSVCAMSEGLYLAEKAGLDLEQTLEVVSGGAAGSWSLDNYAPRVLQGDYKPGFFAKDMLKDLRIALKEVQAFDTTLPGLELSARLYDRLVKSEKDPVGNHALIKLYRQGLQEK